MERKDNLLKIKMMNAVLKGLRLSLLPPQSFCVMAGKMFKTFTDEEQLSVAPTKASFGEVLQTKSMGALL